MILPNKENITDDMVIKILNARFYSEYPVYKVDEFSHRLAYDITRCIYYGDRITLLQEYSIGVINVLKYYAIIDSGETVDTLLRDGELRANKEISAAFSSPEVQSALSGLLNIVEDFNDSNKDKKTESFDTKEISVLNLNLN